MIPITIDGFMASLIAAESIKGCRGILHGPGACRGQNCGLTKRLTSPKFSGREGPFYYGNECVPCTYLDGDDYIHGANYKMEDLLDTLEDTELAVIVLSPGTSLIGDDLVGSVSHSRFGNKVIVQKMCHMSEPAQVGYDSTIAEIVRSVCSKSEIVKDSVIVARLPVLTQGWEVTKEELTEYLKLMGLSVTAFVGAGCTVEELKRSSSAEYCFTVLPEFCPSILNEYSLLGVECRELPIPFGFSGVRKWIESVAEATGKDPSKALEVLEKRSARIRNLLMNEGHGSSMTRGMTYGVYLESELTVDLVKWLYSYLGMFPVCIRKCNWWSSSRTKELEEFLEGIRCSDTLVEDFSVERCDAL
ncbi:MAG: hypothetical protein MJZ21_05020, partial [archaeon]|nr:hypothetical protein [archaeon]